MLRPTRLRSVQIAVLIFSYLLGVGLTFALPKRSVRYTDLPLQIREILRERGITELNFPDFIQSINRRTMDREREGEREALIYFILQSRRFTHEPAIEPALSARDFVARLSPGDRNRLLQGDTAFVPPVEMLPEGVSRRMGDFVQSSKRATSDARLRSFKALIESSESDPRSVDRMLRASYARAMRFLYQKEFSPKDLSAALKGTLLASLYEERGHSTDTRIEANYAVWTALTVLKQLDPSLALNRVLIVGPGLDLAPRTDLVDAVPPQSYQPYAVADALLALGLSSPDKLRIDCVDINEGVVGFLDSFASRGERKLTVLSSLKKSDHDSLWPEFNSYFDKLGSHIGQEVPIQGDAAQIPFLGKAVEVRRAVAETITAARLNIITERYDPAPGYDAVVVTNVFLYFNSSELALALANIEAMLRPGGYLIHNELRPELEILSRSFDMEPVQARTIPLSRLAGSPLVDGFVIHRKSSMALR